MNYRFLGKSGLQLSMLSYGTWATFGKNVDEKLGMELISIAYESGINFFDCAENYEDGLAEMMLGRIFSRHSWRRDSYCLSSKVFFGGEKPTQIGLHRKHIFDACNASLKRMKTDYIDVYLCHRPDPNTPIIETLWAMNNLIKQGKILYWGTSEWSEQNILEACRLAKLNYLIGPTMEQSQYNIFIRSKVEKELSALYEKVGLGLSIWSPLHFGVLAGRYLSGISNTRASYSDHVWLVNELKSKLGQKRLLSVKKLKQLSDEFGCSLAQLALAWCLSNKDVTTILLGASKAKQLRENIVVSTYSTNKLDEIRRSVDLVIKEGVVS